MHYSLRERQLLGLDSCQWSLIRPGFCSTGRPCRSTATKQGAPHRYAHPPVAWLWFCDWDLSDLTAAVLVASSLAGGLMSRLILPRLTAGMTPNTSLERTRE